MPGRFVSPPNPYDEFDVGCLKVYYPDNPLLFQALMGQLATLESRFVWNTGGDIAAAEKLAQDWHDAGDLTRGSSASGCVEDCPDVTDFETEIIRLTEIITEYENMNITVNCNCCCGGAGGDFIGPIGPIETVPIQIDPLDPLGVIVPTWDEVGQVPPNGFDTWQSFVDERCRLANYAFDTALDVVSSLDQLENRSGPILDIVSVLMLFLPTPAAKTGGIIKIIKWVTAFLKFAEEVSDDFEEILDYLQIIRDAMVANRQDIVCALYTYGNARNAVTVATQLILNVPPIILLPEPYRNAITQLVTDLIPDNFYLTWNAAMLQLVPNSYLGITDCESCDGPVAPVGYAYVKANPVQVLAFGGTGVSALAPSAPGDVVTLDFSASSAARTARLDIVFEPRPELSVGEEWVGFRHTPVLVSNVQNMGLSSPTDTTTSFSGFILASVNSSVPVNVYLSGTNHPATPEGELGYQSGGLNFAPDKVRTGYTCQSVTSGNCSASWGGFYWVKKLA